MSKKLKLPPLSNKTRILSFDLETNGLHGKAFAIGAVVVDAKGNILDQFSARTNVVGPLDSWVKLNVLPAIEDMPITHGSYEELREAFWKWYKQNEPKSDYVLVRNGYPAEYRFLLECQEADIGNRYWDHPFPILDLLSLLMQVGEGPSTNRVEFVKEFLTKHTRKPHHPVQDATIAALAAFKAFRQSGQIA